MDGDPQGVRGAARTVEAPLHYLAPMHGRPQNYPGDPARTVLTLDRRVMAIEDVSFTADKPRLDREGLQLVPHRTAITDFRVAAGRDELYRAEIESMMLELTGAAKVVAAGGALHRLAERARDFGAAGSTTPIRIIHADYSRLSGPAFAGALLPPQDRARFAGKRSAGYSVWRALSPAPLDVPLAVCDARSVAAGDWVGGDVVLTPPGRDPIQWEGSFYLHNPHHRWCYFSTMTREEALVFKTHDTDFTLAERVAHTAFDDPSAPPDAAPRESVDIRVVAYFDD